MLLGARNMPARQTPVSKSAFIRKQPATLSAAEVVAKAKAAGLKFDVQYVYKVRAYDEAAGKVTKPTKAAPPATKPSAPTVKVTTRSTMVRKSASVPRPITTTASAETLLRALGAELGLGRAVEILAGERARVHSILRG